MAPTTSPTGAAPMVAMNTVNSWNPRLSPSGAGAAVTTDQSSARLVSAVSGVGTLAALPLGLDITLKPDWKTYWRSPGDAGFPPEVTFDGSENLGTATLAYPTPHRFELFHRDVHFPRL